MVQVKPFKGLRPKPDMVDKVASPPYDVLSSEEARRKTEGNPYSFLHVVKPEIDLDPSIDVHDASVYEKGAANLRRLIEEDVMIRDTKPNFYAYKLRMGEHEQIGLVALASVDDYEADRVKKHEHTRPDKEQDRVNHIDRQNAQAGPVFLTYRADAKVDALMEKAMSKDPVYDFTGDYDIQHTFYVIDDESLIRDIEDTFKQIDSLYVADGHHRSAAAQRVRDLRMQNNKDHTGKESYNYFLTVIFPDSQMQILDYNRVVKDLNDLSVDQFLDRVSETFDVDLLGPSGGCCGQDHSESFRPAHTDEFGLYIDGQWYRLVAKTGSFDKSDPIDSLAVSILQNNILSSILNIQDPRTDDRVQFVGGIRGLKALEYLVDNGEYAAAFALYPTTIAQLLAVADAGKVMPPKSTWFEPKLRSGIVVHMLDE